MTRLIRFARLDRARAARTGGTGANGAAAELSARLLGEAPLADDGPLHVTAAARLAFVPWAALRGLQPLTWSLVVAAGVAPRPAAPSGDVTVIVGPDVPNGASEARRVASHYASSVLLDADAATPQEALAALGRNGIVHLAAHAGRRGDDPLLSWIELAGGALSNSTLVAERVRAGCVVLSACEAAAAAGDVSAGIVDPGRDHRPPRRRDRDRRHRPRAPRRRRGADGCGPRPARGRRADRRRAPDGPRRAAREPRRSELRLPHRRRVT